MGRMLVMIFAAAAAVFFILGGGALFSQESPKGVGAKLGVVDLYEISQKWKKWIDLAEAVEKEVKAKRDVIEEEKKKILDAENKLARAGYAENSEERLKEMTAIQSARLRLEWLDASENERLEKTAAKFGKDLLSEIETAIKKYGRENGFSLILKLDETSLEGRNWVQMQSYVRFKQVIFYEDGINITSAIVEILQKK
jgi:Skp family chaperone for outer membrane proteins